jgi:RsmE family RNA methyltransferase
MANSLLVYPDELTPSGSVILAGARAVHAQEDFHDIAPGVSIPASIFGGVRGCATYQEINRERVVLFFEPTAAAIPRNPVSLIVAVSRPQTIKKVIQAGVFLGLEQLFLVRTDLTDKSYLGSRELRSERIAGEVERALEQSGDSCAPEISVHRSLSDAVEKSSHSQSGFFAHPEVMTGARRLSGLEQMKTGEDLLRANVEKEGRDVATSGLTIAIGPERGWSARECGYFRERGYRPLSLGERVLRVDAAMYVAVVSLMRRCFVS